MDLYKSSFFTIALAIAAAALAHAADQATEKAAPTPEGNAYEHQVDPSADSNFSLALFRLWVPPGVERVEGVLVIAPGSDSHSANLPADPEWQRMAAKWNHALLAATFTTRSSLLPYYRADAGSGSALLQSLEHFAKVSDHPEIAEVPLAFIGHSQGGQYGYHFMCWKPERVTAWAAIKGGYYDVEPSPAARKVPGLLIAGEDDMEFRRKNLRGLFDRNAGPETRWAFAMEKGTGHGVDRSLDLIIPFFDAVISGNIDPHTGNIETLETLKTQPAKPGGKESDVWLPSSRAAKAWEFLVNNSWPEHYPLDIPHDDPPKPASVSPASHDFGKVTAGQNADTATFRVRRDHEGPMWNSIRAFSLKGRCKVTSERTGDDFLVHAEPVLDGQPLGRLHDTVAIGFSNDGALVPGLAEIHVTVHHVHDDVTATPHYIYIGAHSETVSKSFEMRANNGKRLVIEDARLESGEAAKIEVKEKTGDRATFTCTFDPLLEDGNHSGVFVVSLTEPIETDYVIPFLGYYKPAEAKDEGADQ